MKKILLLSSLFISFLFASQAGAHCQVPCGIYGDELKFGELKQHVETISKASAKIRELSAKEALTALDHQQIVRWTMNKESHAQKVIDEAANYFLAQRIKPDAAHYAEKVELLHHIIVFSMKAKQQVEATPAKTLLEKIEAFETLYLHHGHSH